MVFDETTSVTRTVTRWLEFYKHESCGKCTPCREGTYWLVDMLRRLESGTGSDERHRENQRRLIADRRAFLLCAW